MTPDQLRRASGCVESLSVAFAEPITAAISRWSVKNIPQFVAQVAIESARFTRMQENLHYSSAERLMRVWPQRFHSSAFAQEYVGNPELLANYVYGGRMGNVEYGDGWKFRGRGLIQLTGRSNYAAYERASVLPVTIDPDLLLDPENAADSAGWYWAWKGCDHVAADPVALTRLVNGGRHGLEERIALTKVAQQVFV